MCTAEVSLCKGWPPEGQCQIYLSFSHHLKISYPSAFLDLSPSPRSLLRAVSPQCVPRCSARCSKRAHHPPAVWPGQSEGLVRSRHFRAALVCSQDVFTHGFLLRVVSSGVSGTLPRRRWIVFRIRKTPLAFLRLVCSHRFPKKRFSSPLSL